MFDEELKEQLRGYFTRIVKPVQLQMHTGEHESRHELKQMLSEVAALSDWIELTEKTDDDVSPVSFDVLSEGKPTGIRFSGIPGGHEFSSLILAILQAGGSPVRLDEGLQNLVRGLEGQMHFQTVVSLSCHNCPDVVQTLNSFALLNPRITHEMIDGALFPEFVEKHGIQGVPAVFLNGEPFANGKIDAGQIIDRIIKKNASSLKVHESDRLYDVAIVGAGPAGVAAAIYSARKGLAVTVIAERIGGQVKDTMGIENLITTSYTTGPELTATLGSLLRSHEVDVREHLRVDHIENGDAYKTIVLNTSERIRSRTVILATGAKWRELNVPGEKEFLGRGVAYCPHCDGPFFKGKDVAVIGGGNSGVEAALDLAGIVRSVKLFEFTDRLNADEVLIRRLKETPNIEAAVNAQVTEVLHDGEKVTGIRYINRTTGEEIEYPLDGIFIQIGLIPGTDFVRGLVECNRYGEIIVDTHGRTSVPGIFAAGDATTVPYKQIVIALGDGAKAAITAFEYLLKQPKMEAVA
jgi:alkyl hydroperoxide reductase subunit F